MVYRQCSKKPIYLLEVKLCLEEMELDLLEGVVREVEEVQVEEVGAEVEWEVTVPEPVPVGGVSVLVVAPDCPIRWEHPVII